MFSRHNGHSSDDHEVKPQNLIWYKHFRDYSKDKLLVLDIDRTLCHFGACDSISSTSVISRPYLHFFLRNVSKHYELALWSATSYDTIVAKMQCLNIYNNIHFKIAFVLDKHSMATIKKTKHKKCTYTKPLHVIWKRCNSYNATNTIILDDSPKNFYYNPQNGLEIIPYEQHMSGTDNALIEVGQYLIKLAQNCNDFTTVDHSNYKNYNPPQ